MAGLLRGKVVAITGSSSGIGRAIAIACAQQGASLLLHHIADAKGEADILSLRDEIRSVNPEPTVHTHASDLTQIGAAEDLVIAATNRFGVLDVLVNNAAYMLNQAAARQMVQQGTGGSIVNIASITATLGSSNLTHYSASKAALLGMTASMSIELRPENIRVNSVCPGTIETTMNKQDLDKPGKREYMTSRVPLRRLGRPGDIAKAVVFFASDLSGYVTGQSLLVDGGASVNYQ